MNRKKTFTVVGYIFYGIAALVVLAMGYDFTSWQYWVILGLMAMSDIITALKYD